jgi:hypothetical protein
MYYKQLRQNLVCVRTTRNSVHKMKHDYVLFKHMSYFTYVFFYTSYAIKNVDNSKTFVRNAGHDLS